MWALAALVGVVISVMIGGVPASALSDSPSWIDERGVLLASVPVDASEKLPFSCGGPSRHIRIFSYPDPVLACVYGEAGKLQVARFVNVEGNSIVAAAYPSDGVFSVVPDICRYASSCVYSQFSDTLLYREQYGSTASRIMVIKDVSKALQRQFSLVIMGNLYRLTAEPHPLIDGGEGSYPVGKMAVSRDGRWVAAHYTYQGIVLIDTSTFSVRRIATAMSTERYDLALSPDGKTVVIASERTHPTIIEVDATCGGWGIGEPGVPYPPEVRACTIGYLSPQDDFEQYYSATVPYFIDTHHLQLLVETRLESRSAIYVPQSLSDLRGGIQYIALGDSFTSGEGEVSDAFYLNHTNTPPHTCHVSSRSYPFLLGESLSLVTRNMSCSGATMADILGSATYAGQGGRLEVLSDDERYAMQNAAVYADRQGVVDQLKFIARYQPERISIGIGGNDAGFMEKLKGCIAPGTCEWAEPGAPRAAVAREIEALAGRYDEVIDRVVQVSPLSQISLIGYPLIINDTPGAVCDIVLGALITAEERQFIVRAITKVNDVMQRAAERAGLKFIDVSEAYLGAKLCDDSATPAMNGLRFGDDISVMASLPKVKIIGAESFHPTPEGHRRVATGIEQSMSGYQRKLSREVSSVQVQDEYWIQGVDSTTDSYRYAVLPQGSVQVFDDKNIHLAVSPGMFAANTTVEAWLQGDTHRYIFTTDESGRVQGYIPRGYDIEVDSLVTTVYIRGATNSDESLIAYTVIQGVNQDQSASEEGGDSEDVAPGNATPSVVSGGNESTFASLISTPALSLPVLSGSAIYSDTPPASVLGSTSVHVSEAKAGQPTSPLSIVSGQILLIIAGVCLGIVGIYRIYSHFARRRK